MDIEEKCDVLLDMNAPDFVERLIEAIGAKPGEKIEITTPQFDRTDGIKPALPMMVFAKLYTLTKETIKQIGCRRWSEADADGNVLWLYPAEWYDYIPNGTQIVDINGEVEQFKHGETDDDWRSGVLAYGYLRKAA